MATDDDDGDGDGDGDGDDDDDDDEDEDEDKDEDSDDDSSREIKNSQNKVFKDNADFSSPFLEGVSVLRLVGPSVRPSVGHAFEKITFSSTFEH